MLEEGRGPRVPRSKGSKVQGSKGPRVPRTKISQTHIQKELDSKEEGPSCYQSILQSCTLVGLKYDLRIVKCQICSMKSLYIFKQYTYVSFICQQLKWNIKLLMRSTNFPPIKMSCVSEK